MPAMTREVLRGEYLQFRVPSAKKARWRAAAADLGVTLTALVERAVDETIDAEFAAVREAERRADERARLRARVFPR